MSEKLLSSGFRVDKDNVLGVGGESTVYAGTRVEDGTPCAVKFPRKHGDKTFDEDTKRRFLREIEVLQTIKHPNVVQVFGAGFDPEEGPFYAMQLLQGVDLRTKEQMGELLLPEKKVAEIIISLAVVLNDLLKDYRVIHRDLKPENIFLEGDTLKVADFGLAKSLLSHGGRKTTQGLLSGTPDYIAPENLSRPKAVDHRADIYALGVIAYEMLIGRPPMRSGGKIVTSVVLAISETIPTPPQELRPDVSDRFQALVLKMIEKVPDDRYQTYDALLSDLHAIVGKTFARTDAPASPASTASRAKVWGAVLVLSLMAIGAGLMAFGGRKPPDSPHSNNFETPPPPVVNGARKEPPSKKESTNPVEVALAEAMRAYGSGDLQTALAKLLVLFSLDPKHQAGLKLAARIVRETWGQGIAPEVLGEIARSVQKEANSADAYYLLALVNQVLRKPALAWENVSQVYVRNSSYPGAHELGARIALARRNSTMASQELSDAGVAAGTLASLVALALEVERVASDEDNQLARFERIVQIAGSLGEWTESPQTGARDPLLIECALYYRIYAISLLDARRGLELAKEAATEKGFTAPPPPSKAVDFGHIIARCDRQLGELKISPTERLLLLRSHIPEKHQPRLDLLATELRFAKQVAASKFESVITQFQDRTLEAARPGYRAFRVAAESILRSATFKRLKLDPKQWEIADSGNAETARKPLRTMSDDGMSVTTGERQVAAVSLLPYARDGYELDLTLLPAGGSARAYVLLHHDGGTRSIVLRLRETKWELVERVKPNHAETDGQLFAEESIEPKSPQILTVLKWKGRVLVYLNRLPAHVFNENFQLEEGLWLVIKQGKLRVTYIKLAAHDTRKAEQPDKGDDQ